MREGINMKNCLKIIGIILIILIVIFAIHTIRNYVIITNLQNKIGTYINSDNYFIESSTKQGDAVSMNLKCYKKGNKQVTFLDTISSLLSNIFDIERITSRLISLRATPKDLIWLKLSLESVPELKAMLSSYPSVFGEYVLEGFEDLYNLINKNRKAL